MNYSMLHQIKSYVKNPVFYIICIGIFFMLYWSLSYFFVEIPHTGIDEKKDMYTHGDMDVQQGYIPVNKKERLTVGLKTIEQELNGDFGLSKKETSEVMAEIKRKGINEGEIIKYLRRNYNYQLNKSFFERLGVKQANHEQLEHYVTFALKKDRITAYFGRKFSDMLGVVKRK